VRAAHGARARGSAPSRAWDRHAAGFTLVEIMIALVISTLLVAMIISIFTSMSAAYRTQQQVAELQQILQAAETTVETDVRQAGYGCAQGFTWAGSPTIPVSALTVTDGGYGAQLPDQIAIFYGDPSAQAHVTDVVAPPWPSVDVDAVDPTWAIGDLVLFSVRDTMKLGNMSGNFEAGTRPPEEPPTSDTNSEAANVPYYYACVLQIASISGTKITFSTAAPWGDATESQCAGPSGKLGPTTAAMLFRFVARAYRIDPARKDLSVFQQSPSGGLVANDWTDLGLGFTNFQVASRWYNFAGTDNTDTDADDKRNWYSGSNQDTLTTADLLASYGGTLSTLEVPLQVSVSFVVRTTRRVVDGTVTSATPELQDPTNPDANDVGNSPKVQLAGVSDSSRPQELRGDNIYRYATIKIDTRNLGVNR
jgi:prepilin-type N-terminal cleavage/methylation domain-containing protein